MQKTTEPNSAAKKVAFVVCAYRIGNTPPIYNLALSLGEAGYHVLVFGYWAEGLRPVERLSKRVRILRTRLWNRRLPVAMLRKVAATLEFLWKTRVMHRRLQPDVIVAFNDPATLAMAVVSSRSCKRVQWMLEFSERELMGFCERWLMRVCERLWTKAEIFVAPTAERLALHLGRRPECLSLQTFVVHNSPRTGELADVPSSPNGEAAAVAMMEARARGDLVVLYAGAIGLRYEIDKLIEGVGMLSAPAMLLILGKKHELSAAEVNASLARCAHSEWVLWVDEVPYRELPALVALADVGFAAYQPDTLNTKFCAPGKIYEYLKGGVLVMTDDESSIAAELRYTGAGLLLSRPITTRSVATALGTLVGRPEEVRRRREAARRLFEERFAFERQVTPVLDALGQGES